MLFVKRIKLVLDKLLMCVWNKLHIFSGMATTRATKAVASDHKHFLGPTALF